MIHRTIGASSAGLDLPLQASPSQQILAAAKVAQKQISLMDAAALGQKPQQIVKVQQISQQQVVPPAVSETVKKQVPGTSTPMDLYLMGMAGFLPQEQGFVQGPYVARKSPMGLGLMGMAGNFNQFSINSI